MRHAIPGAILVMIALVPGIEAAENTVFSDVFTHYEAIRRVLIEDSTDGIPEHAAAIAAAVDGLERNFSSTAAGVSPENAEAVELLLPEINSRAKQVASAQDLESSRNDLALLTKPLVRWHALVEGERPVVAYCPMVKKAWLQPDEAIGNPYAPNMLRCGDVVQR